MAKLILNFFFVVVFLFFVVVQYVGAAHNYPSTVSAKAAISALGREIQHGSIPKSVGPLVFVFTGAGNVSKVFIHTYIHMLCTYVHTIHNVFIQDFLLGEGLGACPIEDMPLEIIELELTKMFFNYTFH